MVRFTRALPLRMLNAVSMTFCDDSLRMPSCGALATGTRRVMRSLANSTT